MRLKKVAYLNFSIYCLIIILSAVITYWFSITAVKMPTEFRLPVYDAELYFLMAKEIQKNGLFNFDEIYLRAFEIRTYLYVFLLSLLDPQSPSFYGRVVWFNWAIYLYSAYLVSQTFFSVTVLKRIGFAVLALNPLILVYCAYYLTDILCVALSLISLSLIIRAIKIQPYYILLAWWLIAINIMIRPAAIFVVPLAGIMTLWLVYQNDNFIQRIQLIGLSALLFLLPLLPQFYMNWVHFGQLGFLPVFDLGDAQVQWGIRYLKYATNASEVGDPRLIYPNIFLENTDGTLSLSWYFQYPWAGIKTLLFKLAAAFHFDYLHPYVTQLHPNKIYFMTTTVSTLIFVCGLIGLWMKKALRPVYLSSIIFLFGWLGVHLPSAIELRFTLPALAILSFYAIYVGVYLLKRPLNIHKKIYITLIFALYTVCMIMGHIVFQSRIIA